MKLRILSIILLLLVSTTPAFAQAKLKKLVFEDCAKAEAELAQLPAPQHAEFVSYLARVLRMQTGVTGEAFAEGPGATPVGGSRDVLTGGNMWRIFEPSREKEAKQCALKLIAQKGAAAFFAVPELVQVFQESSLAPELRDALEQTVWNITLAYKQENPGSGDPRVFSGLISELTSESSGYLAGDILVELHQASLPHLITALASPDMKRRDAVQSLLLRLDPYGSLIGPSLLPLLESGDEDLRVKGLRILSRLEGFYPQALPAVFNRLADPAPSVVDAAYNALKHIFADGKAPRALVLDTAQGAQLINALALAPYDRRTVLEPVLVQLLVSHPELASEIIELKKSPEADLRERAVRIVARSGLGQEIVLPVLLDGLYDSSLPVRLAAVRGLALSPERAEEKASALLRLLKGSASERDANTRARLVLAVAETSEQLPVTPSLKRLTPYFVDGLAYQSLGDGGDGAKVENAAVRALLHLGSEPLGALTKALKDNDVLVRLRAVRVLSSIKPLERQTGKSLAFMLRDADDGVRAEAERAMILLGPEYTPEVKKGLNWKEPGAQLAAARVLAAYGEKDPQLVNVFRDSFSRVECREKYSLVAPLLSLDAQFREKIQPFLLDCLVNAKTNPLEALAVLEKTAPLQESVLGRFSDAIKEASFPRNIRLQLAARGPRLGVPPADAANALVGFLKESDNAVRTQAAMLLADMGPGAAAAVPALKEIVEDKSADGLLRSKAAYAIAQISPEAYDWARYFIKELEGDRSQWAFATIADMKPAQAVPFLERALKEVSLEKRSLVVSLVARFGPDSQALKPELVRLLKEGDPYTRFQSVLAIARIDPQEPELLPALRRELVGRYTKELQGAKLPEAVAPLLEQVVSQPRSFVEERTARALLAQLGADKPPA